MRKVCQEAAGGVIVVNLLIYINMHMIVTFKGRDGGIKELPIFRQIDFILALCIGVCY
jgi:hypothetical protein